MYDLIGDIHGHADELEALLVRLGYSESGGSYRHPELKAVFVGDLIDRGPKIARTIDVVRRMVDSGHALIVMGNHELNALALHNVDPQTGEPFRARTTKNLRQTAATIAQLGSELRSVVEWFWTLPLWLELPGLRVVHAAWDPSAIETVRNRLRDATLTFPTFIEANQPDSELHRAVNTLLKGPEYRLPRGLTYLDVDGHAREHMRVQWYRPSKGHSYGSYALPVNEALLASTPALRTIRLDSTCRPMEGYPAAEEPIFFGHYWLSEAVPSLLAPNVCCLDYSVAKKGALVSYRFHGEKVLSNKHFTTQPLVWLGAARANVSS